MPRRAPLPPALQGVAFTRQHAMQLGVPDRRLEASDLVRLDTGLFAPSGQELSELARATALRFATPRLWLSHDSAARHYGLYLPRQADSLLHVSVPPGSGRRRTSAVKCHEILVLQGEVRDVGPVPGAPSTLRGWITSRSRTWLDLASTLAVDDLVVIGDQLVRKPWDGGAPVTTRDALQKLCDAHGKALGISKARKALELIRVGSHSRPETLLRLALIRAGLPEPELQISPDPQNRYAPQGDMGYRQIKLVLQYEGEHHRTPEQLSRDLNRDREWLRYGWKSLRYDRSDLRNGFVRAVSEVRECLELSSVNFP